jgi:hypothetical protein
MPDFIVRLFFFAYRRLRKRDACARPTEIVPPMRLARGKQRAEAGDLANSFKTLRLGKRVHADAFALLRRLFETDLAVD